MKDSVFTILNELKAMRVKLSIDDFGTGYSSLSYLKKFPINTLKIDQSFVRSIEKDSDNAAIVTAIITLAKTLNLNVIAEGVETEAELDFFKGKNCEIIQGYIYSHPLTLEDFLEFLQKNTVRMAG